MSKKPLITNFIKTSDKNEQYHGNYVVSAILDNGSKLTYFNVRYKATTLTITYPNGRHKTFFNDINNNNFSNTKYSEAVKQVIEQLFNA